MTNTTLTREEQEQQVYACICAIAAHCDGAIAQDGQGFNGQDTKFGRRIAQIPFESWTPEIRQEAARILGNTYRQQAQQWTGIDISQLDVVRENAEVYTNHVARQQARDAERSRLAASNRFLTLEGENLVFKFPYDAQLKDALKAAGCRWNGYSWWISKTQVSKKLVNVIISAGFKYDDAVDALLVAGAEVEVPEVGTVAVKHGVLVVTLTGSLSRDDFASYRQLDGYRWVKGTNSSTVDATQHNLDWLSTKGFEGVSEAAVEVAGALQAQQDRLAASRAATSDFNLSSVIPDGLAAKDFQVAGVEYAVENERVIIADEMGLGKTVQAILAVKYTNAYPAVVVCPASLKGNWAKELAKWDPEHDVQVLSGRSAGKVEGDWVVVNYDIVEAWVDQLVEAQPESLTLDESHYVKNPQAKRTKALVKLANG